MKKINTLLALLSALLLLGACEKDGEKFYLSSPVESDLIASTNAVVLTEATAKLYALSLAWSDQTLQISDPRYQATSGIQTTVQVSRSEDFSGSIIFTENNRIFIIKRSHLRIRNISSRFYCNYHILTNPRYSKRNPLL